MSQTKIPQTLSAPRYSRSAKVDREIEFDFRLRALKDQHDPVIEQIFLEYKVIDSKTQALLTFIGLLWVVQASVGSWAFVGVCMRVRACGFPIF